MIDFDRFWAEGNSPYVEEDEDEEETEVPSGVTPGEILAWEGQHGVKLPEPLRAALGIRNGGYVRDTDVEVLPLDQFEPVDDDFWKWTEIEEDEAPDHGLLFAFGNEAQSGGTYLLNFNERGPEGPPSVYIDIHGETTYRINDSILGFFEAELASDAGPSVDWSEAESSPSVVARESIDESALHDGEPASNDQILAREGGALILFTRHRSPEGESLTRTRLPLPLDTDAFEVPRTRPAPIGTFILHLQPEQTEGIVHARSERIDDGRWKNSTGRGVPIFVMFESTDRGRLEAVRTEVFGVEGAASIQARYDRQAEAEAMLGTLTPEQRSAAFLQAALNRREEVQAQFAASGGLDDLPPELAEAARLMRLRMEQMAEMVRQRAAANPPDAETIQRVEGYLRDQGPK